VTFPPGGMSYFQTRSEWREFGYALHALQRAIEPQTSLNTVLSRWNEWAKMLAEPTRKRRLQGLGILS
jgi:hypothetical protein